MIIDNIFSDLISILISSSQQFISNIERHHQCIPDRNVYLKLKYSNAHKKFRNKLGRLLSRLKNLKKKYFRGIT